jgi:hypothetical protein
MAERPTVGDLKARGAIGAIVSCRFCRHSARLTFDQLRAADDDVFAEVFERSRMRCTSCQADKFSFTVEWGAKPPGGLI